MFLCNYKTILAEQSLEYLAKKVLDFWFGPLDQSLQCGEEFSKKWFQKDNEFDRQVKRQFSSYLDSAVMGAFDRWSQEPIACVALIVMLDQFPRNCFRNHAKSFYFDAKALHFAKYMTDNDYYRQLSPPYAYFCIMPFMHSEELSDQKLCISYYEELEAMVTPEHKKLFQSAIHYAKLHRDVIDQFGRFPHRNEALKRDSTAEEVYYLKQPGSGF